MMLFSHALSSLLTADVILKRIAYKTIQIRSARMRMGSVNVCLVVCKRIDVSDAAPAIQRIGQRMALGIGISTPVTVMSLERLNARLTSSVMKMQTT